MEWISMSQKFLLDSSVWVNFLKGDVPTRTTINKAVSDGYVISNCGPVVMEVLSGARIHEESKVTSMLDSFLTLSHDIHADYRTAGIMYRELRRKGVTVKGSMDCLIAVIAMNHDDVTLIHDDQDFELIAQHYDLKQERWARAA